MKCIFLHSSYLEFEPKKEALKGAEKVKRFKRHIDECLVVFSAAEKNDEAKEVGVAKNLVKNVGEISEQLKTRRVVLYPWVHLTANPSKPETALKILKESGKILEKQGFEVYRAPFGWYKEFEIHVKGHPLSELSRKIGELEEGETKAIAAERKLKSHWNIITPKGVISKIEINGDKIRGFDFSKYENLEKFAKYEMAKSRVSKKEPPHVKYMRALELADYEPGSDPGNFRYYPKGRLIKSLLEEFVSKKTVDYGAMEVETPIMYDFEHPSFKNYVNRFPARQYIIQTPNKRVFLRFSACFGQFLIARDSNMSYKQLPIRLYELTHYSFRVEQRGELSGLRRLRTFTMPDCHAFCKDLEQAKEEVLNRFNLSWEIQSKIGFEVPGDLELALRATRDFYNKNKDFIHELVKMWGKPALLELWDDQFFYFIFKYEWNFVDALEKAGALNTDQIDVENAERYGINYITESGEKKNPLILHLSPSGAIERVIYALLEKAYLDSKKGKKPEFPLWLAPTQVRFIPLSDKFLDSCEDLAKKISKECIRVDIDDRNESVSRKIFDAEKEWVPIIIVIGEKERKGVFKPRIRNLKEKEMDLKEIINYVKEKTEGMPFKKLSLPVKLSQRPKFVG